MLFHWYFYKRYVNMLTWVGINLAVRSYACTVYTAKDRLASLIHANSVAASQYGVAGCAASAVLYLRLSSPQT